MVPVPLPRRRLRRCLYHQLHIPGERALRLQPLRPSIRFADGYGFDITTLGFPKAYNDAIPKEIRRFPYVTISGYAGTVNGELFRPTETFSLPISFDKVQGRHSLRFGGEYRIYRENQYQYDNVSTGSFDFGTGYTQGPLDNSPASPRGQVCACSSVSRP